jgi:carboxylesterase type B
MLTSPIQNFSCNTTTNLSLIFSCVQTAPAPSLFSSIALVARELSPLPTGTAPWEPVVDGTFVADFPTKLLAHHTFSKIPTITGFTSDELTYLIPTSLNISSNTILAGVARVVLSFVPLPTILQLISLDTLAEYPNPGPSIVGGRLENAGQDWKRTTAIASDLFERCPGWAFARNMSLFRPVWKYRWNAALPKQVKLVPEDGIVHGSELPYVFGQSYVGGNPYVVGGASIGGIEEAIDLELSAVVQKAWLSFAKYLNPNRLGELSGLNWPRYCSGMFTIHLSCSDCLVCLGFVFSAQANSNGRIYFILIY